jgi:hypothetical protein
MEILTKLIHDTALAQFTWSDEGVKNLLAEQLTSISKAHARNRAIMFAAEYAYYKANPDTKMDVPSIVYENAEKAYDRWLAQQDTELPPTQQKAIKIC